MAARGRLPQFVALRSRRWGDGPRPPAFQFAGCLLQGFRYSARGGGLCLLCFDSSRSQRQPESMRMAGVGRLPRLTRFAQSGAWQTRRSPRRSTLGPDREGEQPARSRYCPRRVRSRLQAVSRPSKFDPRREEPVRSGRRRWEALREHRWKPQRSLRHLNRRPLDRLRHRPPAAFLPRGLERRLTQR